MTTELIRKRGVVNHTTISQLGAMVHLGISGGRTKIINETTVELPVSNGYHVRIEYMPATDTYTVSRIYRRGLKEWDKGTANLVYNHQLSSAAWNASCFQNVEFGD